MSVNEEMVEKDYSLGFQELELIFSLEVYEPITLQSPAAHIYAHEAEHIGK